MKTSLSSQLLPILEVDKKTISVNQKRNKRLNADDIAIRRQYTRNIIEEFSSKHGRPPREKEIIEQLQLIGFSASHHIIYNDRKAISASSTYLEDLFSIDNYSQYQEDNRKWIDFTIEKASELLEKKWTGSKRISKTTPNGPLTEDIITAELAGPYAQFLKIIQDGIKLREEHADGKNRKLATVKLGKKLRRTEEELFQITEKNKNLEKELKEQMKDAKLPDS